jgi:glutamate synthase (NADPH/NADH) small chain
MEFLVQQNRRIAGDSEDTAQAILATGKHVIVIGGGDTGSDCVGTSVRQGAASVTQLELMPRPSLTRGTANPWPEWPLILRTSTSQEEASRIVLEGGKLRPVPGSDLSLPCGLALLAMGFVGPERPGVVEQLGLALDPRGNIRTDAAGATNVPGVFAAGDNSRGQSLVVWAIADGRRVAAGVDAWLQCAPMARASNG